MSFSVYRITCQPTGKSYIGVTVTGIEQRFARHKRLARLGYKGMPIYDALRAFGEQSFSVELVYEAASKEEMYRVERGLIAAYGTLVPRGLNLATGGFGGFHSCSDAGRKSRSEKMKARWADPKYKARVVAAATAALKNPDVRARMSASISAAKNTPDAKARVSASTKARATPEFEVRRIAAYKATCAKRDEVYRGV